MNHRCMTAVVTVTNRPGQSLTGNAGSPCGFVPHATFDFFESIEEDYCKDMFSDLSLGSDRLDDERVPVRDSLESRVFVVYSHVVE